MQYKKFYEYAPLLILGAVLFFFANNMNYLREIFRITQPVLWGVAISYIMNPVCTFFMQKTNWRWSLNILVGYLLFFIIIAGFIFLVIPIIGENLADFIKSLPSIARAIRDMLIEIEKDLSAGPLAPLVKQLNLGSYIELGFSKIGGLLNGISKLVLVFFKGLSQFILGLIISIYVLLNKESIKQKVFRFLRVRFTDERERAVGDFIRKADRTFGGFLSGKLLDSLIIGIIAFFGFLVLKAPYPLLLALIVGVTNIIPYFGPLIGGVPVVFIVMFVDVKLAIYVAIFIFALQQLDGYYIGPKILGESIGVSPFWVILGVVIGGGFYGVVGMVLGVPTLALINSEFDDYLERREKLIVSKENEPG